MREVLSHFLICWKYLNGLSDIYCLILLKYNPTLPKKYTYKPSFCMMRELHYTKVLMLCFLGIGFMNISFAQTNTNIWNDKNKRDIEVKGKEHIQPSKYRSVSLDAKKLTELLEKAPLENSFEAKLNRIALPIPMPDGTTLNFEIVESPIVGDQLLKKYPMLRTFSGKGIEDPSASIRLDYTDQGFHALIRSAENMVSIDPNSSRDTENYKSYYTHHLTSDEIFNCQVDESLHVHDAHHHDHDHDHDHSRLDNQMRTFQIAISATGEYSAFHGGTTSGVLSAIVTTLNRVNLLFEVEAATRFILVDNNDQLIFLNPDTDPFDNTNLGTMIEQNQTVVDDVIGLANYDVGHVFGTAGGGIAGVGAVCTTSKAWGATGLNSPVGDIFDVTYVCHEVGHQMNSPHTFNSCNGTGGSAIGFEPGSGTTIMAYAGLCGVDNIQTYTDYYYHGASLERIIASGSSCAEYITIDNRAPTVEILSPQNITIPLNTPFELEGVGYDSDGDIISYCWEQMDLGPISTLGQPSGTAPLFRSYAPVSHGVRSFPNVEDLRSGTTRPTEILPFTSRPLNFRLTVRDNNSAGGQTAYQDYSINVGGEAGPFVVNSPTTGSETWEAGENQTVTWDVAGTNVAPVNCNFVDIYLSTDGGVTYPIVLAENAPNTGGTSIVVPNEIGTNNRIKVKAKDNIFLDVSDNDFEIVQPSMATFIIENVTNDQIVCSDGTAQYTIEISPVAGYNQALTFVVDNLPAGTNVEFLPSQITGGGTMQMTISQFSELSADNYSFTLLASDGNLTKNTTGSFEVLSGTDNNRFTGITPLDGQTDKELNTMVSWNAMSEYADYEIQFAANPSFSNILHSATTANNNYTIEELDYLTVYYWRVRGINFCGTSDFSEVNKYKFDHFS